MATKIRNLTLHILYFILLCIQLNKSQRSLALVTSQDPNCLTYQGTNYDMCLKCNYQTQSVLIFLDPSLIICGVFSEMNKTCSFDTQLYGQLSQYSNITLTPFYSGENLLYCKPDKGQLVGSNCLQYQTSSSKHKWKYSDIESAQLFNFSKIKDEIMSETVGSYCQKCPQNYMAELFSIEQTGINYLGCQDGSQCQYYQYLDSGVCKNCDDLFPNCLSCNQSTCLQCPLGYYFNPQVYDFRTNSYIGKCVFGYCPVGTCLSIQSTSCTTSSLSNCTRCSDQLDGTQTCQECQAGYYQVNSTSCSQRVSLSDTQNRFLSPIPQEYLTNSSFTVSPGHSIEYPAYSFHQIIHDMINLLNNNTYSSANFNIYLFQGTHNLIACTGSIEEQQLYKQYPQLTNFCDKLNLQQAYSLIDSIKITVLPLDCGLMTTLGYNSASALFNSVCVDYSTDPNPIIIVNNQYSYFNITGSWKFYNLTFDGANSMVTDILQFSDYSILPTQLCGVVKDPDGYDGLLDIQDVGNLSLTYQCKDSYVPRTFPRPDNYKCFENQGQRVKQSVESSLRCGRVYDESDYFFQNDQGVYTKRQRTLFNIYQFATYETTNVQVPSLQISGCTFKNFYGPFDSLINIEMGSLSRTQFNGQYFYFYTGQQTGGAIMIKNSTFMNSRFCRGAIYFRKMTYDIDYSMSLTNLTLLNRDNNWYTQLLYQFLYFNNVTVFNFNSFTEVAALARFDRRRVYQFINQNVYQPLMLLRPMHVGIFFNVEDYFGSILIVSSTFKNNFHYISEFNNTITLQSENQKVNDFLEVFENSQESAEYKMAICNQNQNQTRSLFGHAFKGVEAQNSDQYYDLFERLSLIYISRNQFLIYIQKCNFINNTGTFGGAISINTPLFSKNQYIAPQIDILESQFVGNFAYLGGGAVYLRLSMNQTQNQGCGDGITISNSYFTNNLVSKLGNGGAISAYCLYVDYRDTLEQSSAFLTDYNYQVTQESGTTSTPFLYVNNDAVNTIDDVEVFAQSQDLFQDFEVKTSFFTVSSCSFILNQAGQNGSALYMFQLTYPLLQQNSFTNNTAISSLYERQYSPFYTYLTQGVAFTFYDQIYGYANDYDFIIDSNFALDSALNAKFGKTSDFSIDLTQLKAAVHMSFCAEVYCLSSITSGSLILDSDFVNNQVGPQFYSTYYEDMTSSLYIFGGSYNYIQLCQFSSHNNTYLTYFDKYKGSSIYDQIYNQTRYAQGSIVSLIIKNDELSEQVGLQQNMLVETNFYSNQHQQLVNENVTEVRYFKGQLINYRTNQQTEYVEAYLLIGACQFVNNVFFGDMSSQIYVEEGLFNWTCNVFNQLGFISDDSNSLYQQQYGAIYINNTVSQIYSTMPSINFITFNYFADIYALEGSIIYFYAANQFVYLNYNAYHQIQSFDKGIYVLEDRFSISRNLIISNDEFYLNIMGRLMYTFNANTDKQQSSIICYTFTNIQFVWNLNEGTVIYAQDLYGVIIIQTITYSGYDQAFAKSDYYYFCYAYLAAYPLQPPCPINNLTSTDPRFISQLKKEDITYYFYFENIGQPYEFNESTTYTDYVLKDVQNTIGQELLDYLYYNYLFTHDDFVAVICWNKVSIYEWQALQANITNQGAMKAVQSHVTYGSFTNPNDEASIQAFFGYKLKIGSIWSIINFSTFYAVFIKMDVLKIYEEASLINIEDSFFSIIQFQMQACSFYSSKLFQIQGQSVVYLHQFVMVDNRGSYQFMYAKSENVSAQIQISTSYIGKIEDNSYNLFYLQNVNFSSISNTFENLIAANVFQGFQSSLYFYESNFSCINQGSYYECDPNVLTGYFYISTDTNLTIDTCIIQNIPGIHSTIINATGGSISLLNTQFLNCSTQMSSSGIISFSFVTQFVNITNCTFQGNVRDIYSYNSSLNLSRNLFQDGQYFFIYLDYSNLVLQSNYFLTLTSPRLQSNAGVYCNCLSLTANQNYFLGLEGYTGGALYFNHYYPYVGPCSITSNIFLKNSAFQGGAVFIQAAKILNVKHNVFSENKAIGSVGDLDFGSGGALYIDCLGTRLNYLYSFGNGTICAITVEGNTFSSNEADNQGGAIMQATSIDIDYSNNVKFVGNTAHYGPDLAKYPQIMLITSLNATQLSDFNSDPSYNKSLNALQQTSFLNYSSGAYIDLQITLYDIFNQRVSAQSQSEATLSTSFFSSESAAINGFKVSINDGQYVFNELQVLLNPGSNQTLLLTLFSLEVYDHEQDAPFAYNPIPIYIEARQCYLGEEWTQNNTCQRCQNQTYILQINLQNVTLCKPCPVGGNCPGGNEIYALDDYQRSDFVQDLFLACNLTGVCIGGNSSQPDGSCAIGYEGKLCTKCTIGYSRENQFQCVECPNKIYNVIQIFFIGVLLVIYISIMVRSTASSQDEVKPLYSVLIKIITNHFQVFSSVTLINFQFPNLIQAYFNGTQKIYFFDRLISIDCFINTADLEIPTFYIKLVFISLLPIFLIFGNLGFWSIYLTIKRKEKFNIKLLVTKSLNTLVIMLYLIYPTITQFLLQIFNCISLDYQIRLATDYSIICYQSQHLLFIIAVALPAIIIWVIGIPFLFTLMTFRFTAIIKKLSDFLSTDPNMEKTEAEFLLLQNRFGFLLNGYNKGAYFWEITIMVRKTLILIISVFFSSFWAEAQMLGAFLIFIICIHLQITYKPYIHSSINKLELISLLALSVNLYVGLHYKSFEYVNYTENQGLDFFFLFLLIIPNVIFLYYWFYYMRRELIRELYKRKLYKIIPFVTCRRFNQDLFYQVYLKKDKQFRRIDSVGGGLMDIEVNKLKLKNIWFDKYASMLKRRKTTNIGFERTETVQISTALHTNKISTNDQTYISNLNLTHQVVSKKLKDNSQFDQAVATPVFSKMIQSYLGDNSKSLFDNFSIAQSNQSIIGLKNSIRGPNNDENQKHPQVMIQVTKRRKKKEKTQWD